MELGRVCDHNMPLNGISTFKCLGHQINHFFEKQARNLLLLIQGGNVKANRIFLMGILCYLLSLICIYHLASAKPIYKIAPSTPYFVGREAFMEKLEKDFHTSAAPYTNLITIAGISGAGKTHIAAKFAEIQRFKKNYDLIWWFDCELSIVHQFLMLAKKLNKHMSAQISTDDPQQIIKTILNYLKKGDMNWLLIFDNADNYEQIKPFIPKNSTFSKAHVLVTSRAKLGWEKTLTPPGLSKEKITLAVNTMSHEKKIQKDDPLIHYLGNSTYLEIEQAANLLRFYQGDTSQLLLKLEQGDLSIHTPLALAVHEAMQQESISRLLGFMAFLHGKKIPLSLLKTWHTKYVDGSEEFEPLMQMLKDQSLIGAVGSYIYIHNTTQAIIRRSLSHEQKMLILNQMVDLFLSLSEEQQNLVSPRFYLYINHAQKVCLHAFKLPTLSRSLYRLNLNIIDETLVRQKNNGLGYQYINTLQPYFTDSLCPYKELIGAYLNKKAYALNALGDIKASYQILLEAKPYLSDQGGLTEYVNNTLYIARRAQEFGDTLNAELNLQEAKMLIEKYNISYLNESLDAYFNQALYYHVSAHYLIDRGQYSEALKYANRAISLLKGLADKLEANEKYSKLALPSFIPQQLALLKLPEQQSRYESIDFLIAKLNQQMGNQPHRFSAFLHTLYAKQLLNTDNIKEAEKELQLALFMYSKINKNKSQSTRYLAYTYTVLGDFFAQQQHLKQAVSQYEQALRCYESSLTHLQIAEVGDLLFKLITTLLQAGDHLSAKYYYQRHAKWLDETYPEIAHSLAQANGLDIQPCVN